MATYFVGSAFDALTPSPTGCTDNGGTVGIDGGGYALAAIVDPDTGAPFAAKVWTHVITATSNYGPGNGIVPFAWLNSDGTPIAQLICTNGDLYQWGLQFWDGSAWVQPGPSVGTGYTTFDFLLSVHPTSGRIAWYANGALMSDVAGLDTSGMSNIAQLRLGRFQGYSGDTRHGSIIMASYSTIGHTVSRRAPTGAGAHSDWTGSYADIDDDGTDDTNAISTSTVGATSTFTTTDLPPPATGNVVKCVAVAARMRSDGGDAPSAAKALLRIGGADYVAAHAMAIGAGYAGAVTCLDRDPVTGQPWASIEHANSEFGLQAVA